MTEHQQPGSSGLHDRIRRRRVLATLLVLLALGVSACAVDSGGDNEPATKKSSSAPTRKAPADPAADFEKALKKSLGKVNRDGVKRVDSAVYNRDTNGVSVRWAINDNLTEGMVKTGVKTDIADMLKAIQKFQKGGNRIKAVSLSGTFSMQDALGNTEESEVVQADYSGDIISQINFDNFSHDNVYKVADSHTLAPAFE